MSINIGYKNNFLYEQEKRSTSSNTRKNSSTVRNKAIDNKDKSSIGGGNSNNINSPYSNNKKAYMSSGLLNNKLENVEDYQRLAKKYYSIILSLQDELTKQTIKNYSLLEDNINLKNQLSLANNQFKMP